MKVDLHVHTRLSGHSLLSVESVARSARRRGLGAVAITDHDEIDAAFELKKVFPTIIGEEVSCDEGDVIGLFLTEKIEGGPALEVMDRIRAQGGLVMIPHPFDGLRKESLRSEGLCARGDLVEVFNSRVVRMKDNEYARSFAERHGLPMVVGSDAHTAIEIGMSWMDLESISDPHSFLRSINGAKVQTRKSPFLVHAQTKIVKLREVFG